MFNPRAFSAIVFNKIMKTLKLNSNFRWKLINKKVEVIKFYISNTRNTSEKIFTLPEYTFVYVKSFVLISLRT